MIILKHPENQGCYPNNLENHGQNYGADNKINYELFLIYY